MGSSISDLPRPAVALVLLLATLPASAATGASADAAGAKSAARAKLVEGVGLLKNGRYGEALERFKDAYALVPSPLIAYDFGLAYLGLGDPARALESFQRFLDEARDAPADKRQKAERYRAELRGQVGIVELGADVGAADLTVDGRSLGRTPFPRRLYLEPGAHQIVARATDGGTHVATVTCGAGQTVPLAIHLLPSVAEAPAAVAPLAPAGAGLATDLGRPGHLALPGHIGRPNAIEATPPSRPPASANRTGVWGLSAAGLGVISVGVGVAFGVMAKNAGDALTDDSENGRDFRPDLEAAGLRNQRLETVFLSVGAAAIVAGVGLYVLARHRAGGGPPLQQGTP